MPERLESGTAEKKNFFQEALIFLLLVLGIYSKDFFLLL